MANEIKSLNIGNTQYDIDYSPSKNFCLPLTGGTLSGHLSSNSGYTIIQPYGAQYSTTNSTKTGCITIILPASIGNTMVSMWIDVYEYSTQKSFTVHCGGYTYSNSTWANSPFAMVYGATHRVRLGHNGTNFVIYIGETNTSWSYPQIHVRNVTLGYSPTLANWQKMWSINFSTSVQNVTYDTTTYAWTSKLFSTYSPESVVSAGYSTSDHRTGIVPTLNFISYWNGAYNVAGGSNLKYCDRGRFGTIITKSTSDYMPAGDTSHGTHVTTGAQTWSGVKTFAAVPVFNSGINSVGSILLSGTDSNTAHIKFSRNSYNYITWPDGYSLAFGKEPGSVNTFFRMTNAAFFPETTNNFTLGTSSLKWSNVYATTFTGNLTGNVTGNCSGSSGSCAGNAATATKLKTARSISLTGAVTGATTFDGSGNVSITTAENDPKFTMSSVITYDYTTRKFSTSKTDNSWNANVYSNYGYSSGCYMSFKPSQTTQYIMVGLNSDPTKDANYNSLDYCWYCQSNGSVCVYESGTCKAVDKTTYTAGDDFRITYDGKYIRYFCNGTLYRTVERAIGDKLYFDSSFYNAGSIYDVEFGLISTHVNYANSAGSATDQTARDAAAAAQNTANGKWTYNASTIAGVKVNNAVNADTATSATTATKLSSDAGSATNPIYFSGGKPAACTYSLNKTVPENAVFTDTASGKTFKTLSSASHTGWTNATTDNKIIPTMSFMAYWNGAYASSGASNLTYCNKGAFGNAVTYGVTTSITSGSSSLITSGAVYTGLAGKADSSHTHTKSEITDFPSSLPASDVYSWAKAATKPTYKTSEVAEETNLYFTDQRAINACSGAYLSATGGDLIGATNYNSLPNANKLFGTGQGLIHIRNSNGGNYYGNAITWAYSNNTAAQAGIYVTTGGSYGSEMWFGTTNSFANGVYAALKIDNVGKIHAVRNNFVGNLTGNCSGSSGSCTGNAATATNVAWTGVTGKPTTFDPSAHTHTKSEITDFPDSLPANGGSATYAARLGTSTAYYTKATLDTALAGKADVSHGTHVTSGAQTWSGVKTFSSGLVSSADITATGKMYAAGFYESSDARLKNIEKPLEVDFNDLAKLQKIYFKFKSNPDKTEIGVIAQEVKEIYPELVSEDENGNLSVAYDKLAVIALAAVDKLNERLERIEKLLGF